MTKPATANAAVEAPPPWWNVHARLMPDYNARAALYWWSVVALGYGLLGASVLRLVERGPEVWLHVAVCTALAALAGLMPVRVPGSTSSFTAGETFIFVLLLLHGTEAAVVAAAGEAFMGSLRTSRRWTSRIGSPPISAASLYASGLMVQTIESALSALGVANATRLFVDAILFSTFYFVINTLLVSVLPALKNNRPLHLRTLFASFGWLGMAYSANAVVAAFLTLSFRTIGLVAVIAAAPVIAILLTTGHYYFRRREADDAVESARRSEAEQARQHVAQLEASEQRFHSAFTHASIGMALVTFDGQVRQVNVALTQLLGLDDGPGGRLDFSAFVADDDSTTLANLIARSAATDARGFAGELKCAHRDGAELWIAVAGSRFSEPGSSEPCLILQVQDITARHRAEADLHHIAFHDSLTGLPNRHRFNEHLVAAIARAQEDAQHAYGVLFLDFDRFKLINDSLGHTVGDQFLVKVAHRIGESLRAGDVVARLGGDEFAILLQGPAAPQTIVALADRLQQTLAQPFSLAATDIAVSASMGITFSSFGYASPEEVLRDADIAMYRAKAAGKARHALFDIGLRQQVANRMRLEGDLRRALASDGLSVDYQPLFDLQSRRLIGFEALARWRHPELGVISPAEFIPIAEESGSMVQLTDFVLGDACGRLKGWQQVHPRFGRLKMHVNIAGNDVTSANFVQRIARAVMVSRLEPETLSIELTENILMESLESAMDRLNELHALGIGLSVDDFGTGYSSLSHLSTLPIDSLKIDRSFVRNLVPGSKEAAVIRAIVLLGQSLGKEVIAEGIETERQLAALAELGCDVAQGYLLGRPMPPERVDGLLADELRHVVAAEPTRPVLALTG